MYTKSHLFSKYTLRMMFIYNITAEALLCTKLYLSKQQKANSEADNQRRDSAGRNAEKDCDQARPSNVTSTRGPLKAFRPISTQYKVAPVRGPLKAFSTASAETKAPMKGYGQPTRATPPAPMNSATDVEMKKVSEEEIGESVMKKQQGDSYVTPKSLVASIKKFPTVMTPEAQQISKNFASILPKRRTSIPVSNQRRIMTAQPANRRNSTPTCSSPRSRRNSSSKGKVVGYDYHGRPQYESHVIKNKSSGSSKKKFSDRLYTENWVKNYSSPLNVFPNGRRPHTTAVEKRPQKEEAKEKPHLKLVSKKPTTVKYNASGRLTTKIAPRYLIPSSSPAQHQPRNSGSDASEEASSRSGRRCKRGFD